MKKKKRYQTAAFKRKVQALLRMVGNNMRALRQSNKESLKTVAKIARISASHLSRMERGLVPGFNLTVLGLICRYYDEEMRDIVTRGYKPKGSKAYFLTTKTTTRKLKKPVKN